MSTFTKSTFSRVRNLVENPWTELQEFYFTHKLNEGQSKDSQQIILEEPKWICAALPRISDCAFLNVPMVYNELKMFVRQKSEKILLAGAH